MRELTPEMCIVYRVNPRMALSWDTDMMYLAGEEVSSSFRFISESRNVNIVMVVEVVVVSAVAMVIAAGVAAAMVVVVVEMVLVMVITMVMGESRW